MEATSTVPDGGTRVRVGDLVDAIEAAILSGELPVGSALPGERALAASHGVGRPLVREAIRSLAARGLLEIQPGRGTFVRSVTGIGNLDSVDLSRRATARQMVESRIVIESQTARLAAQRATATQVDLLEACLDAMDRTSDPVERGQFDLTFHLAISRASANPVLEAMLGSIAPLMVQHIMRSSADGTTAAISHPYHRECFEAIRRGDGDAAARAMEAHLRVADDTYGNGYDEPLNTVTNTYARSLIKSYGSLDNLVDAIVRPAGGSRQPTLDSTQ